MSVSVHEQLRRAKFLRSDAAQKVTKLEDEVESRNIKLAAGLPVSAENPCTVGILPSGEVAVQIFTYDNRSTEVYVVSPGYIEADGTARVKYPSELLGTPCGT